MLRSDNPTKVTEVTVMWRRYNDCENNDIVNIDTPSSLQSVSESLIIVSLGRSGQAKDHCYWFRKTNINYTVVRKRGNTAIVQRETTGT